MINSFYLNLIDMEYARRCLSNEEAIEEVMKEMGIEELKDTVRVAISPEVTHL